MRHTKIIIGVTGSPPLREPMGPSRSLVEKSGSLHGEATLLTSASRRCRTFVRRDDALLRGSGREDPFCHRHYGIDYGSLQFKAVTVPRAVNSKQQRENRMKLLIVLATMGVITTAAL